jgi:hypothetical protein
MQAIKNTRSKCLSICLWLPTTHISMLIPYKKFNFISINLFLLSVYNTKFSILVLAHIRPLFIYFSLSLSYKLFLSINQVLGIFLFSSRSLSCCYIMRHLEFPVNVTLDECGAKKSNSNPRSFMIASKNNIYCMMTSSARDLRLL